MVNRELYLQSAHIVAPALLGKLLVHHSAEGMTSGIIVEVEAYIGPTDKASHSYQNKRTKRTEIQFGIGGFAYIYSIYGIHSCFNVVVNYENKPEVVLVRALEPVGGIELMQQRRLCKSTIDLCNGPGRLCQAMGITKAQYGYDLCVDSLYIESQPSLPDSNIQISPRINIDYAAECKDYLWRYYIKDSLYVSKVAKRYTLPEVKSGKTLGR